MAQLKTLSVYDKAVGAYLPPFNVRSIPEGVRAFADMANREGHSFNNHPADYTLFLIGDFDEETGLYTQDGAHSSLGTALELMDHPAQPDQMNLVV